MDKAPLRGLFPYNFPVRRKKLAALYSSVPSLEGQRFLITGASSGIGLALALHLLRKGASLVLTYRSEAHRKKASDAISLLDVDGNVTWLPLEQGSRSSIDSFLQRTKGISFNGVAFNAGSYFEKGEEGIFPTPLFDANATAVLSIFESLYQSNPDARFAFVTSLVAVSPAGGFLSLRGRKLAKGESYRLAKEAQRALFMLALRNGAKAYLTAPGLTRTNIYREGAPFIKKEAVRLLALFAFDNESASLPLFLSLSGAYPPGVYLVPRLGGGVKTKSVRAALWSEEGKEILALIDENAS